MRYFLVLVFCLSCFFGCQNVRQPKKPKDLISKNKMVDILTETYLANAARSVDNNKIKEKGIAIDSLIYKNFGIDSLQFAKSNDYYAANVNEYMAIFQEVEKNLDKMQKRMDSLWEAKRDSTDNIYDKLNEKKPLKESLKDTLS